MPPKPSFVISMFPAHGAASGVGFYHCHSHRSSSTQTKGADLIYGSFVMPPALGMAEVFGGGQGVGATGHGARSVILTLPSA
jgi:hypothetical protein